MARHPWLFTLILAAISQLTVKGYLAQSSNPRIVEHPEDQYVAKNEPATLNCKAEGDPAPIITWYRNGQPVITANENPSSHRMLLPSGQLFFLRIIHNKNNKPDVGVYHCAATNPTTKVSVTSHNATLEIAVLRDDFKTMPQNSEVAFGDTAILDCRAPKGLPEPRIKWKKDGEAIHPHGRVTVHENGNLVIQDARKEDTGMYVCIAHNIAGEKESSPARLAVKEKPKFLRSPQDLQVEENDDAKFSCQATGDPPPTIIWKREEGAIPQGRSHILEDRSLKIERVKVADEGIYICRAENNVGYVEALARLTVHSQPTFIVTPQDKVVGVGRTVSLRCTVTGNPPPAVFWNRETSQVLMFPRQDHGRFSVNDDGTLIIEPVKKDDAGEYVCQALSVAGSAFAKARIEVKDVDPRPPPIIHQGPQNQTLPINSVAMLQCHSSGDPRPTIRWYKNNRPLSTRDPRIALLDSGTLQISDLKEHDSALYTCKASSETGETSWSAALTVEAPTNTAVIFHRTPEPSTFPGAPSKPAVSEIHEAWMKLTWKANANHGASPIIAYTVEYFSHETGEGWVVASDSIKGQNVQVRGLRPDTSYMFLVRARNSHGLSLPSQVAGPYRTTGSSGGKGVRPTMPQFDIALVSEKLTGHIVHMRKPEAITSTAIKLNWEVLKSQRFIEGFHIKYRVMPDIYEHLSHSKSNSNHRHVEYTIETVSSGTATMYVLRNLRKYTVYEIRVQPFYLTVEGQESNMERVRTKEDYPSAGPTNIVARLLDNDTMHLTWSPPPKEHHNGPMKGYKIYCMGNETRFNRNITVNATTHSLVIRHLVKGMVYRISIAAVNIRGVGIRSKPYLVGGESAQGLIQGFVREPWFIATLIGTIGGTLWFALCVFSVWLYRKKKARKKMHKNGVMTVPVHKTDDASRLAPRNHQTTMLLSPPVANGNASTSVDTMQPDITNVERTKEDVMKENLYNTPNVTHAPPMKTFYNKNAMPVAPYATTTLITQGNNLLNQREHSGDSAFRPIQKSGYIQQGSGSSDSCQKPEGNDSNSDNSRPNTELIPEQYQLDPNMTSPGMRMSPAPDYNSLLAEEERLRQMGKIPLPPMLFLPPPPEHPPPSDIGTPPDSPVSPRGLDHAGRMHYPMSDGTYASVPHSDGEGGYQPGSLALRGGGNPQNSSRNPPPPYPGMHTTGRPHSPPGHGHHPMSPTSRCRTMSPRAHMDSRAYSPRAMSEPERGPTPPVRAYKLVPIRDQDPGRHYSDTEGAPAPPLRMLQSHTPPSPAPEDPMMDRACQSSLPSLANEFMQHNARMKLLLHSPQTRHRQSLEQGPDGPQLSLLGDHYLANRADSPTGSDALLPEYEMDSDMEHMEGPTHHRDCHTPESSNGDVDTVTGSMLASWASITDNSDNCSSARSSALSSSDGSFFAEADFASAVAKAAELSGLTVVGSTVTDPNAGREKVCGAFPVRKPAKHRDRERATRQRPTSPYSTDSNYSTVNVPHRPYPKSERKKQLQEQQGQKYSPVAAPRTNSRNKPKPPTHVSDMPSYNKPSFPSPSGSAPLGRNPFSPNSNNNGQYSTDRQQRSNASTPKTPTFPNGVNDPGGIRQNPLTMAFDTSDTPIV